MKISYESEIVTILPAILRALFPSSFARRWALSAQDSKEMSIRATVRHFIQNGQIFLRILRNTEGLKFNSYPRSSPNNIQLAQVGKSQGHLPQNGNNVSTMGRSLGFLGAQARRIFVDNILKRVTNSLSANLRKRATNRLLYGDSTPFFALVGVSLASGTGLLTKDDEFEGVCWEIREAVTKLQWNKPENDSNYEPTMLNDHLMNLEKFNVGPIIAKGCSAVVYNARFRSSISDNVNTKEEGNANSFPFAIKMMFNYDAESNSTAILKSMYRETVPARQYYKNEELRNLELQLAPNKLTLPPHANIVAMYNVFIDNVTALPGSFGVYPDALPARINPEGSGRNMSLFLLMKRYDVTLKQYLVDREINIRESVLLLAQLLEGIAHMNSHGVAHRDLKSDNILLDLSEENDNCPTLVITDFGCCLADESHGLYLPYNTGDVDIGGNIALMAPEVLSAKPGPFTSINYSKSDLWTAGTIAYEMFGMKNPFYKTTNEDLVLKNCNYNDGELPSLPNDVPNIVNALVKNMLSKNINKRLCIEIAATVMQLYLWAPSSWLKKEEKIASSDEIMQWLLCLTTKVLCEGSKIMFDQSKDPSCDIKRQEEIRRNYQRSLSTRSCGRRTMPEYQLIASFLGRVTLSNVRVALKWIHRVE